HVTGVQTCALPISSRRPETTRRAPSLAKAKAVARPMPVRAPVIKTTGLFIALLLLPWRPLWARIAALKKTLYAEWHTSQAWNGYGIEASAVFRGRGRVVQL